MVTIHKYTLNPSIPRIETFTGAELLTVEMQGGMAVMWARVDTSKGSCARELRIVGTGHPDATGVYVGTFMPSPDLVFHVFDLGESYYGYDPSLDSSRGDGKDE